MGVQFVTMLDSAAGVLNRRARLSHTFLDHDILFVNDDEAVTRLSMGEWPFMMPRLRRGLADCMALFQDFMQFSASTLIDLLPPLLSLAVDRRAALKCELDAKVADLLEESGAAARALTALGELRTAFQQFEAVVSHGQADQVTSSWRAVRDAAKGLKALFVDGTVPRGIMIP